MAIGNQEATSFATERADDLLHLTDLANFADHRAGLDTFRKRVQMESSGDRCNYHDVISPRRHLSHIGLESSLWIRQRRQAFFLFPVVVARSKVIVRSIPTATGPNAFHLTGVRFVTCSATAETISARDSLCIAKRPQRPSFNDSSREAKKEGQDGAS